MKGFRAVLRESDEFSSMPHDHLHSELHGVLTGHGAEPQQYEDDSHHYSSHGWRSKGHRLVAVNHIDDFEAQNDHDWKIQGHLPRLGFKRSPIHDIDIGNHPHMDSDQASFGSQAWTHPNGSMLYAHHGYDEHHDDGVWTDYELRTPRAR